MAFVLPKNTNAYARWSENCVEFKSDSLRTLIAFVWNKEKTGEEEKAIETCEYVGAIKKASGFEMNSSETCYELCPGKTVSEVAAILENVAPLVFNYPKNFVR